MNDTTSSPGTTTRPNGRPPLRRPRQGRMLAGVAAGISDHLGIDVAIVRILVVVATFVTSGFAVLVYVVAIFVIPEADDQEERLAGEARSARATDGIGSQRDPAFWIGVGLLVFGVLWLFGGVLSPFRGPGWIGPELIWPLVLIGFGLALWKSGDRRVADQPRTSPAPPGPAWPVAPPPPPTGTRTGPAAPAHTPPPWAERDTQTTERIMTTQPTARLQAPSHQDVPGGDPTVAAPPARNGDPDGSAGAIPPPPPGTPLPADGEDGWTPPGTPKRSLLTRLTLAAVLVTVGVLWSLDLAGLATIGVSRLVAAALLVVGVGLLIGTWFGRGRWLILVGSLLLPVVILAELLRPFGLVDLPRADVRGGFGELVVAPADLTELDASYQLGAGSIRLDLSDLDIDEPTDLSIQLGAGEVIVQLPADVTADVTVRVGVGEHTVDDQSRGGFGVPPRQQQIEHGEGSEPLTLEVNVGFGEATIRGANVNGLGGLAPRAEPSAFGPPLQPDRTDRPNRADQPDRPDRHEQRERALLHAS